jgi:competence ComEA-like helix-hairpin-helix protein
MPTGNERRALWFLAMVALSGSVVRLLRARNPQPEVTPNAGLERQIGRVDSARERRSAAKRGGRPPRLQGDTAPATGPLDLDRASVAEIEALPGIGASLAKRIVAHRDSAGPFRSADQFCEVKGVGQSLVSRLAPRVVFSGESVPRDACKVRVLRAPESHVTNRRKRR